ncbi:metallophosphoesterase [Plastoroseomonas arctica]|uniref:Phosphodiesterase n=1 Tax=Plastoroseomonas arctica TaxID=1509237 RepID=A0AAF1KMM5_9PROT|nr:metallophosphoesterase [Plastoroseomonas arctica]MBR0655739.1 phosphodiesterase [Plastoroseomonas arctica]
MTPFHFLHLTDPHIAPPDELLFGQDTNARFAAAVAAIAAEAATTPFAFAILSGDLARDGEPDAYRELARMLEALPCPTHLMLGNHDDRAAFAAAFPDTPLDVNGFCQQAFETPAGRCILLDTLTPGAPHGTLCAVRLGWLADRLAEGDGPVLLFLHHPPMPIGIPGMDAIRLLDGAALLSVLEPHRARIRHMFHGHTHRALAGSWRGIPTSSLRGTAFEVKFAAGQPAIERAAPIEYAIVRCEAESIGVHLAAAAPLA